MKEKKYLEVYKNIKEDILSGAYKSGKKLLSKRIIAEKFGVSVITVEHALDILYDEGYIYSKERSGYFVCYKESDGFMGRDTSSNGGEIGNDIKINTEFPYSVYAKAVRKVLNDSEKGILGATSKSGIFSLRKAISDYLKRSRGIDVSLDRIIIGSGSEYLYGLIVRTIGLDKIYAIETPSYKQIENVYLSYGVQIEKLTLSNGGIKSVDLNRSKAQVLHVSPYRSYPTGFSATAGKKMEYVEWAKKNNAIIIEDDFESEFSIKAKPVETVYSFDKEERTIYINTFSKTISPSIRTGYMILPNRLKNDFEKNVGFYRCTVPTIDQLTLAELLNSGEFERYINKERRKIRKSLIK